MRYPNNREHDRQTDINRVKPKLDTIRTSTNIYPILQNNHNVESKDQTKPIFSKTTQVIQKKL